MKTIEQTFEIRTYDVWGNAEDGYEVNNVFSAGKVTLDVPVKVYNEGTPQQFESPEITDDQIRQALGLRRNFPIETDGDDTIIYVNSERTGKPLGELFLIA